MIDVVEALKTDALYKETEELIAVIAKSIETAQNNRGSQKTEY